MKRKSISLEERKVIEAMLKKRFTAGAIANAIGVHIGSIQREFRKNCHRDGYNAEKAHEVATNRRSTWYVKHQSLKPIEEPPTFKSRLRAVETALEVIEMQLAIVIERLNEQVR